MARKKTESVEKKKKTLKQTAKTQTTKSKTKSKPSKKGNKSKSEQLDDSAIVIVDDDLTIDKEKEIEERRAYLEEARSQEAFD